MKRYLFSIIAVILLNNPAIGQNFSNLNTKIDPIIGKIMESYVIPGLAVGIVKDNEIVFQKGYGVKNIDLKTKITKESLFHMASVSKPFVATAIVQLMEKGKIDINDPVVKYLTYFKLNDERYKDITIQQMLSHTSGMPDTDDYGWDNPEYDEGAAERYTKSLVNEKLVYKPGTNFGYSNIAFEVLGDVISKVSGMPFEDYVKKNILDPIGMKNSTFLKSEISNELNTSPHIRLYETEVSKIYPYNRAHAPSSTLHSNISEMCKWAMVNLNRGILNNRRILNEESYKLLWKQYTRGIGLSWFMGRFNKIQTIRHGGGDTGYATEFVMMPEKNIAIVVLSNCDYAPVWEISRIIFGIIFEQDYTIPNPPAFIPISRFIKHNDINELLAYINELRENQKEEYTFDEDQLDYLGKSFLVSGKMDIAIEIFELNLEIFPNSANAYYHLGKAYLTAGRKNLAVAYLSKSLKMDPENINAQRLLAIITDK